MRKQSNLNCNEKSSRLKKINACEFRQTAKKIYDKQINEGMKQIKQKENYTSIYKHYASSVQLIYSPFQKDVYLPPHLNSSQVYRNLFQSQCANWSIRSNSYRKYDYDQLYQAHQNRYKVLSANTKKSSKNRKRNNVKSKIKYLLDQDRLSYLHFEKKRPASCAKRERHSDDDLSEESSKCQELKP